MSVMDDEQFNEPRAVPAQSAPRCLARTREGLECAYKPHDSRNHCWFDPDSPPPPGMPLDPVDLDANKAALAATKEPK